MDTKQIKVIRALWGPLEDFIEEIPLSPTLNETVVVWGQENYDYLLKLGYDCIFIQDNIENLHSLDMFRLKLEAIEHTASIHGRVLFLDWDTIQIRALDKFFYEDFDDKVFSCPLYCYPDSIQSQLEKLQDDPTNEWFRVMYNNLFNNSWKSLNSMIVPMAGFIYVSNHTVAKELLDIATTYRLRGLIEELAIFKLANCSLDEYISKYEPKTIWGRPSSQTFRLGGVKGYYYKKLNEYISNKVTKKVYFVHK